MANTTTLATLISTRDKLQTAVDKLAGEGVTSYSLGDQTFSLADVGDLLDQIEKLDRRIAMKSSTLGRGRPRNRITFAKFNG